MWLKEILLAQFGKPTGGLGKLVGRLMTGSNKELPNWTVEQLKPKRSDRLLEVGYGPGLTIQLVADKLGSGLIAGVDHSELMYRMALKRNRKHCDNKKAILHYGTIDDLEYPDMYFNTIYGNNVHFFWKDPAREFLKLRQLLKQDGKLLMIFQPRQARTIEEIRELAAACRWQFEQAGFSNVKIELKQGKPVPMISVTGYNRVAVNIIYPGIKRNFYSLNVLENMR